MDKYQEALDYVEKCGRCEEDENCKKCVVKNECSFPTAINKLQELVDKAKPKKPTYLNYGGYKIGNYHCPNCNSIIITNNRNATLPKHCDECDQLLDWSELR